MSSAVTTIIFSLVSVLLVSLVSLAGLVTLSMDEARLRRTATVFISLAVGVLLGDALLHLIPEAFAQRGSAGERVARSLLVLSGILVFFVTEKLLRREPGVVPARPRDPSSLVRPELAAINLAGDSIHNFIDGVLIGASYLASPTLGISTTLAVLLHEIPQELGDFAILIHSGLSTRSALLLNLACGSTAVLGTLVALVIGSIAQQALVGWLLPVTAGGFIYLACANLIPELQHDRSVRALFVQTGLISLGIALMGVLTLVG